MEGEEGEQDYQISCRFNELSVKGLKNKERRLQPSQLGVLIYGRNLSIKGGEVNPLIREALKCSRTHLIEKKAVRTIDSITEEELLMLDEKYLG